jgi:hypothetical protein
MGFIQIVIFLRSNLFVNYGRDIHKVTLSLGLLSPPNPSFSGIRKVMKLYETSQYEMLKLGTKC